MIKGSLYLIRGFQPRNVYSSVEKLCRGIIGLADFVLLEEPQKHQPGALKAYLTTFFPLRKEDLQAMEYARIKANPQSPWIWENIASRFTSQPPRVQQGKGYDLGNCLLEPMATNIIQRQEWLDWERDVLIKCLSPKYVMPSYLSGRSFPYPDFGAFPFYYPYAITTAANMNNNYAAPMFTYTAAITADPGEPIAYEPYYR